MVADVFFIINQALSQVNSWFDSLLNATGFYVVVIGLVVLIIFFRLIIFPLLGSFWRPAGSDTVYSAQTRYEMDSNGYWVNKGTTMTVTHKNLTESERSV